MQQFGWSCSSREFSAYPDMAVQRRCGSVESEDKVVACNVNKRPPTCRQFRGFVDIARRLGRAIESQILLTLYR
jgi:hypothetical protein